MDLAWLSKKNPAPVLNRQYHAGKSQLKLIEKYIHALFPFSHCNLDIKFCMYLIT